MSMPKTTRRIGLILLMVVLLPVIFFSAKELSSLDENEGFIREIYLKQLESILFSVNQYHHDAVNTGSTKLNFYISSPDSSRDNKIDDYFMNTPALKTFFYFDDVGEQHFYFNDSVRDAVYLKRQLSKTLKENEEEIRKLEHYFVSAGWKKILPIRLNRKEGMILYLFYGNYKYSVPVLCGMLIEPGEYIQQVLGGYLQRVAEDKFTITIINGNTGDVVFNSDIKADNGTGEIDNDYTEDVWLLPGYKYGISLNGDTIEEMVWRRAKINLLLIALVDIFLIVGVWLVFKNVKREVKLAQIKSEFISNVSHEIRTPLALISMYIETLEMGRVKAERIKEYYKVICRETLRLSNIVNKILNFSQIESGKRKYRMVDVSINDVIHKVIESYSQHLERKGFSFDLQLADNLPMIQTDREVLEESLINLLDNAVKYSNNDKHITIISGKLNKYVYLEVKDQGVGIPDDKQKHIFDKFYRVTHGNLAHQAKGTGLGLAIVKNFMDECKGKITLISKVGVGSSFRLNFPAQQKNK